VSNVEEGSLVIVDQQANNSKPPVSPAGQFIPGRFVTALGVAAIISLTAILLPKLLFTGKVVPLLTTQATELILSLGAIIILGKGRFADYGFRLPGPDHLSRSPLARWLPVSLGALALGAMATGAILISGVAGNPFLGQLTFPQIVLFVWIFSSIIEEVFTRGFLQGYLSTATTISVKLPFIRVGLPTLVSALFFAAIHLVLLLHGAGLATMVIILLFTFSLGLMAGHLRATTGSLIPAIGVHMLANIGGVIGGMVYAIITLMTGGTLPRM
jgi:membrane protease YdiL (CAAX protease family)